MHYREFHRRMVNRIRREQLTIAAPTDSSGVHRDLKDPTVLKLNNKNNSNSNSNDCESSRETWNVMVGQSNQSQSIECPE